MKKLLVSLFVLFLTAPLDAAQYSFISLRPVPATPLALRLRPSLLLFQTAQTSPGRTAGGGGGVTSPIAGDFVSTGKWTFGSAADAANTVRLGETAGAIVGEGATADAFETTLAFGDATADNTLTMTGLAAGVTLAASTGVITVADNDFAIVDETDATKKWAADVTGMTTANTATMTLSGTAAAPTWTATGWTLNVGDGTAGAPSLAWASDADGSGTGIFRGAANDISFSGNGATGGVLAISASTGTIRATSSYRFGWTATNASAVVDTTLRRLAAGTITQTGATATSIGSLLGGGGAVASADPLPVPTGIVFHVTGTTNFTNITTTNMITGACFTMIFDGALTITDGGNLKLSANYTTSADDTLTVCFDGTNYYETGRSVN